MVPNPMDFAPIIYLVSESPLKNAFSMQYARSSALMKIWAFGLGIGHPQQLLYNKNHPILLELRLF